MSDIPSHVAKIVADNIARLQAERDQFRAALKVLCAEVDFMLSGGDDPDDKCSECGCAGYGMLRDARNNAKKLLDD